MALCTEDKRAPKFQINKKIQTEDNWTWTSCFETKEAPYTCLWRAVVLAFLYPRSDRQAAAGWLMLRYDMLWDQKPNTHMLWRRKSAAWEREIPSLHGGIYPARVSDRDQRFSAHGLEGRKVCTLFHAYARDQKVSRRPRRNTPSQCYSCKRLWLSRHDYVPPACSCDISIGFSDLAHSSEGNLHRHDL